MFPKGKRVGLFLSIMVLYWFSFYAYSPVFTEYVKGFSTSQMAGTIIASYGFMQMLLRIPVGILSDKLKTRKLFVIVSAVLSMISALGLAFFQTPGMALVFRGLAGVAVSAWVPFTILFSSYFKPEEATRAMGIVNAFNFGGQMTATLLGGFAADITGDVRWAFFLSAIAAFVAAGLSFFIIDQPKEEFGEGGVSLKAVVGVAKDKKLMLASLLAMLNRFACFATMYGFTPTFAKEQMGASQSQLGILATLITLPAIFSAASSSKFCKATKGLHNALLITFSVTAVYCAVVPFIMDLTVLYIAQFICGFALGISTSMLMGYSIEDISPKLRATAMGFYQAIYGLGMTLGPQIVGWFGKSAVGETNLPGLTTGFLVVAVTQVIAGGIAWFFVKKFSKKAEA
jgi:MFS family permease